MQIQECKIRKKKLNLLYKKNAFNSNLTLEEKFKSDLILEGNSVQIKY